MTKQEFYSILNKMESIFACNVNFREETNEGIVWLHQDSGVCVDVQDYLLKNNIPRWTHWCAFDRICGRYYVGFKMPRKIEE